MPQRSKRKQQLQTTWEKKRKLSAATAEPATDGQTVDAVDSESEIESDLEYEPIFIPDLPGEEPGVDFEGNDSLSNHLKGNNQITHFQYQQGAVPSRQTQWRITKEKDALRAAATGSADISTMFFAQREKNGQILKVPPQPIISKIRDDAIKQLEVRVGRNQHSKKIVL